MPYQVGWLVEDRVIEEKFIGNITVDDIANAAQAGNALAASAPGMVHLLADASDVKTFPIDLRLIQTTMQPHSLAGKFSWVIVYGTRNPMLRFVAQVSAQFSLVQIRFRVVDHREHALQMLRDLDPSLNL
ncbi:MAG: hypothetical protein JNJ61_15295 [Anaerolineae bacterium]|nr:hypothetical protein [Anaerolineae bacterium]